MKSTLKSYAESVIVKNTKKSIIKEFAMKQCLNCGKQLQDSTTKCFFCGADADQLPQPQQNGLAGIWKKNRDMVILVLILIFLVIGFLVKNILK